MKYLDYENYDKDFTPFEFKSNADINKNTGKRIVYLRKCDIDYNRGYFFRRYGTIESAKNSTIFLMGGDSIDKRDLVEMGIKNEKN